MSFPLQIAVCSNEEYSRRCIKGQIERYSQKKGISCHVEFFQNEMEFCKDELQLYTFDVIFLDIDATGMNGIKTAYTIRKRNQKIDIVFISSITDYAPEGYRLNAVRYILKDNLNRMLPECIHALLERQQRKGSKMSFKFIDGKRRITLNELLYIESNAHKLCFERKGETLYMYGKISELADKLALHDFVRTHQSFLVNLQYIDKIGRYSLALSNGMVLPVAKSRYRTVKECFLQYRD